MLKARDIMTTDVITIEAGASVRDLALLLHTNRISGVPVLGDGGRVIGVVTESDLIYQNKQVHIPTAVAILDSFLFLESPAKTEKELKKIAGTTVGEICSDALFSASPDSTIEELATMMTEKKVHTIPIMDEDRLIGIVGKSDIIRIIAQGQ